MPDHRDTFPRHDQRTPSEFKAWRQSRVGFGTLLAILPVLGAGIGWLVTTAYSAATIEHTVEANKHSVTKHIDSEGHPQTVRRLDRVENRQTVIIEKLDSGFKDVNEQLKQLRYTNRRR